MASEIAAVTSSVPTLVTETATAAATMAMDDPLCVPPTPEEMANCLKIRVILSGLSICMSLVAIFFIYLMIMARVNAIRAARQVQGHTQQIEIPDRLMEQLGLAFALKRTGGNRFDSVDGPGLFVIPPGEKGDPLCQHCVYNSARATEKYEELGDYEDDEDYDGDDSRGSYCDADVKPAHDELSA